MVAGELSRKQERLLALGAQRLAGPRPRGGAAGVVRALGAIQLDTISVLARSHLLVCWSRLGGEATSRTERALWSDPPTTFEYWGHAACILPIEDWPLFAFRRRERLARGRRWHHLARPEPVLAAIRSRLAESACTASDLGGAKAGGPWWDWTEEKIAVEWLLDTGEVVCTRRIGWRRVYDLAERAIPADLRALELDDATCRARLVEQAGAALGVATASELASYHYLRTGDVRAVLERTSLVPVRVEQSTRVHYAHPDALALVDRPLRSRTTLVSPFDSLLWDRRRAERIFGLAHRIEAYTPAPRRVHGYYPMPVLAGGELVARVDPKRDGTILRARQVTLERPGVERAVARSLWDAARWVGASSVEVGALDPLADRRALERALRDCARSSSQVPAAPMPRAPVPRAPVPTA